MKTSIRLLLTALLISGIAWATAGTPSSQASPQATSLASHDR